MPVEELQSIIESEELNVKNEKVVWECVLRWINHDVDNRKGHIVGLLKGVRLGLLDAKFFKEEVSKHPYVTENEACKPVILETSAFLRDVQMMTKEDKDFVIARIARSGIPRDILFAIGGCRYGTLTDVIETYDIRANRWSVLEQVDSIGPRAYHGSAVVGFEIYVIGGYDGGSEGLNTCHCFNAATKTWREVAPMHERRFTLIVAVLRGEVYAMGGFSGNLLLNKAERYECKTNQWSLIAPMKTAHCNASVAVLSDKIYVAGGCDIYNTHLKTVEVYDPDTSFATFS
ncbi:kelch-like protein 10 [Zootermopsis nevadensis]|uniref:kelch-like protein 10 n=1 Tax=Zootermopsis nevadensis TaxID=136037 RepID=UPI000B8E9C39|nr:kelch-like protein 10 [Zootermopsis nevadensis]